MLGFDARRADFHALHELGVRHISVSDCFSAACRSGFEQVAQQFGDLSPESCSAA